MIGRLTGRLATKAPDQVLLDVGGIGYLVHIPLSTFYELPEQESPASLWIHTHVREDALALYGFLTERERALFLLLLPHRPLTVGVASFLLRAGLKELIAP